MMKLKIYLIVLGIVFCNAYAEAQKFELKSPDENILLIVNASGKVSWSVDFMGKTIIEKVDIAMSLKDLLVMGENPEVIDHTISAEKENLLVVVPHKDSKIVDEYSQLQLDFKSDYSIIFRAYNDGVAYQFIGNQEGKVKVSSETMDVSFPANTSSFFPLEETMYSHYERIYIPTRIDTIGKKEFCSLPVLFRTESEVNILFSEAGLHDYPALFLEGNEDNSLHAIFPKYVLEAKPNINNSPDRNELITKEAEYIAKTDGKRAFPWRVFIIGDDKTLVESNLIYQLSRPLAIEETDWIKAGRVAWDWYNANNIFGVDFRSGLNTDTYKYYIDFASENGIEYVILDEGWTKSTTEILEYNPEIDVPALIEYSKLKNVGIILWVLWKPLDDKMQEILDTYAAWGAKGIKVDFMQRADQYMVNSYAEIAREAAKRKLLVDYHGAFKPAGLRREYPNVLSYEGVKGNENNKWSRDITPEHNVTLPFTRMVAGPMDFTPGSMRNNREINFSISFDRPQTMGTRCHQVAMYVVFESPIQMLCENPSIYKKEQETVDFITQIPSVWDETIVLEASVADYIVVARRNGDNWFVGAMTDWTAREFEIDFSFLKDGQYEIEIMQDGINADHYAEDYKIVLREINKDTKIQIALSSGGGWVGIVTKK